MEKSYWLSYDLGVGGNYDKLYGWLDDHNAVPCGDSVAFEKEMLPVDWLWYSISKWSSSVNVVFMQ